MTQNNKKSALGSGGRNKKNHRYTPDILTGKFFHSFDPSCGRCVEWQGYIDGRIGAGGEATYLVTTFDWLIGTEHSKHLVRLKEMTNWQFFSDGESMKNAYENGLKFRPEDCPVHSAEGRKKLEKEREIARMLQEMVDGDGGRQEDRVSNV